jgi:hypothetical protein
MLDLWRKVLELLRANPILLVPYICADLSTSVLSWVRSFAQHQIVVWVRTQQSVLGFKVEPYNIDAIKKAAMLSTPINVGTYLVSAWLYVAAFVVIASLVALILQDKEARIGQALPDLAGRVKRTLLYCVILLVTTVLVFVPLSLSSVWLMTHYDSVGPNMWLAEKNATVLLALFAVAWFMTPGAIRLLRPSESGAVSSQAKKYGRYTAIAVEAAIVALAIIIPKLLTGVMIERGLAWNTYTAVLSIVVNLPYVPFFVALALIAHETPLESQESKVRGVLENLMPLHFNGDSGESDK